MGFPYLKIQKLPNCNFMFFDRYEIHIQDFEDFFTGIFIIFWCPSSHNLIKGGTQNFQQIWHTHFQANQILLFPDLQKYGFQGYPYICSCSLEAFWYSEMNKYRVPRVRNPEIMECGDSGL